MRLLMLSGLLLLPIRAFLQPPDDPVRPVPYTEVQRRDNFRRNRLETVRKVTIPHAFGQWESTGRLRNFDIAACVAEGSFGTSNAFDDSDVYKVIEGAAHTLQGHPDTTLEPCLDSLVDRIAAAQEPDGYPRVYRFDDESTLGGCRIPQQWQVRYLNGKETCFPGDADPDPAGRAERNTDRAGADPCPPAGIHRAGRILRRGTGVGGPLMPAAGAGRPDGPDYARSVTPVRFRGRASTPKTGIGAEAGSSAA